MGSTVSLLPREAVELPYHLRVRSSLAAPRARRHLALRARAARVARFPPLPQSERPDSTLELSFRSVRPSVRSSVLPLRFACCALPQHFHTTPA